ncbi:hypothetical protein OIU84_027056 [Salix udensis]|uniref:Uncharacterized protein n=1 Tax=Salix udensis TaxID=889485 RepID=A0AAD6KEE7_9ROSI|nr:hypothetical protein OIU84_027056 [Salix udensis]
MSKPASAILHKRDLLYLHHNKVEQTCKRSSFCWTTFFHRITFFHWITFFSRRTFYNWDTFFSRRTFYNWDTFFSRRTFYT